MNPENHPVNIEAMQLAATHQQADRRRQGTAAPRGGYTEQPITKVCSACGSEDCGMEAATKWDVASQAWIVSTIYDNSGYCNACGASNGEVEIKDEPVAGDVERTYTVFVRQTDGHGTTHISVQTATNPVHALPMAKKEASEEWGGWPIEDIVGHGIIVGDVEIVAWDDDAE